ncbi:MAG: type I-E CRISPR-associated endoribonuclease Cas2 [Bacteroidetes bacterium]|nr:type I-E CRISPR-associated endoribonuclease Cas2 [Bacteroidota bacterium]
MTVIILESVNPSLKGNLSKWMIEVKPGCFIGKTNALIREHLWERCVKFAGMGSVIQIWHSPSEQGFELRCHNLRGREIVDFDGITLVRMLCADEGT